MAEGGVCMRGKGHPSTTLRVPYTNFVHVNRQCSRTGCAETAILTLSYDYGRAQVWLDDLIPERDPHRYDLCERHGDRVSVPQGWMMRDRRPVSNWALAV
jgi:hypothetical protein